MLRVLLPVIAALLSGWVAAQPAVLRDLRLRDQHAQVLAPASFQGRVLLVNFVFTGCSTTCPTQVRELAAMLRGLPADVRAGLHLLSVSVDARNDTPATLAAFAKRHDADLPGWRFATGDVQQVETLIERMAATDMRRPLRRAEDHRTALWLYDGDGLLVQRYVGVPVDRLRLTEEISQLVRMPRRPGTPR